MRPENNFVHFKHICWFLFKQSWSSSHQMNAGKGYNSNPKFTKRQKLDRVATVDNTPTNDKNWGPKQWWIGLWLQNFHIVPQLSEGIWWSSNNVIYFLGSSRAKDQFPGHQRLIDCSLPESRIVNPQAINPGINVNNQTKQYITRAKLSVFYRALTI